MCQMESALVAKARSLKGEAHSSLVDIC
uniref:Uncharacterized protein n=1 Tax=Arundo donax TaxID=35708 RepID=A0A0A8YMX9_ARUDO